MARVRALRVARDAHRRCIEASVAGPPFRHQTGGGPMWGDLGSGKEAQQTQASRSHGAPRQSLEDALAAVSPRIVPRDATWAGRLIHGTVTALWVLLFARAFFLHGLVAWATGIAYVLYDTLLLFFVTMKSWPLAKRIMPSQPVGTQRMPEMGIIVASHNEAA